MNEISIKKGIVYLTAAQIIMMGTGFLIHFWIGRNLGPESYGVYGLVLALMGVFNLFLVWGIPRSLSKYLSENEESKEEIFRKGFIGQLIFGFILFVFYFFISPLVASILKDKDLIPYIQFSALVIPFYAIFSIFNGYFNGLRRFHIQSFLTILYSAVKMAAAIFFAYAFAVYGAISAFIIAPFVASVVAVPFFLRDYKKPRVIDKTFPFKKIIKFALPFMGLATFLFIQRELGLFLVKTFLRDNVLTGYYNAANTVAKIPYMFLEALAIVALPVVAKNLSSENIKKVKTIVKKVVWLLTIILTPAIFIAFFTSKDVLGFLYGKSYLEGAYVFPILILSHSLLVFFLVLSNIYSALKSPAAPFKISILIVLMNFILSFYLVPYFYLSGAAFGTLFAAALGFIAMFGLVFKEIGSFLKLRFLIKIILISLLTTLPALFLDLPVFLLPFKYAVILAFYFIVLWLFREIKKEDVIVFRDIILFRKNK